MFVTDLMTAVLLFAQFSILRSRSLLVLASGYILDAGVPKAVKNAVVFGLRGVEVLMAYGGVNEVDLTADKHGSGEPTRRRMFCFRLHLFNDAHAEVLGTDAARRCRTQHQADSRSQSI
jgi:hypothetical protein